MPGPASGPATSHPTRTGPPSGSAFWHAPRLLLTLAVLFWSGNFVIGRAVHTAVPPVALAFWRWTVAFLLVFFPARPHLRRDLPVLRMHLRPVLLLSATGVAAFNTLVYIGLHTTTAVNALLLQSFMPLAILATAWVLFRERTRAIQLAALALSVIGVAIIIGRGSPGAVLRLSFNAGDGLVLIAVFCYALYSVLLRRRPPVHPLSLVAAMFAIGSALLLPLYLAESLLFEPLRPGTAAFAAIAYVAFFPSLLSYLFYNRGVELLGAARAGQFVHLMPVFGALLAFVFLGERLHGFHAVGIALIAAGLAITARAPRPPGA